MVFSSSDVAFEAARRGQRLTADGVRKAAREHRLQSSLVTVGGQRLFAADAVDAWLVSRALRRRGSSGG
jgi:hypothetical protein